MDLSAFLSAELLGYFAVFARLGSAMVFMPGFGEQTVPIRHRLFLAVALSVALAPATGVGPLDIDAPAALLALFALEITIGFWIGATARVLMSALQFAGYQVGVVSGLANAFAPNTGAFEGATTIATLLLVAATALLFITDLHQYIIAALVSSYDVFPVGTLMIEDLADQLVRAGAQSFYIGLSIAAPFYLLGLLVNVGMGLANRMMATLPVFFVAAPLLIGVSFLLLALAVPVMIRGFFGPFGDWLQSFSF